MPPCIKTKGLTKRFGRHVALNNVSIEVNPGEVMGLLGPNGAGKSTLIGLLAGLLRPSAGTASIFGMDVYTRHTALAKRVGVLVERPQVYGHLTVEQNLWIHARLSQTQVSTGRVLDLLRLAHLARTPARQLSHGTVQRLSVALAMLTEPEVLLLDEPATALDVEAAEDLFKLLRRLAVESRVTILIASHHMEHMEQMTDRVAILNRGELLRVEETDALLTYDKSRATVLLDGAENAARRLADLPWVRSAEARKGRVDVILEGESIHQLNLFLTQAGYQVSGILPRRRSIREFFLRVVEEDTAAHAPSAGDAP